MEIKYIKHTYTGTHLSQKMAQDLCTFYTKIHNRMVELYLISVSHRIIGNTTVHMSSMRTKPYFANAFPDVFVFTQPVSGFVNIFIRNLELSSFK